MAMWRMNGLWRRMAGALLLCALLLSSEVMCQDDAGTAAPAADAETVAAASSAPGASAAADVGTAPTAAPTAAPSAAAGESDASATPANNPLSAPLPTIALDNLQGGGPSAATAAPVVDDTVADDSLIVRTVVPDVMCVGKEDISESEAVKAVMATDDCEATKRIIQENPAGWCRKENCNLKVFQSGNTVLLASEDANLETLAKALKSEHLKEKLGVTKTETPSSSGSSVFVGILVSGLLAAIAITVGYLKCQRRTETKGVRLLTHVTL
ncbi:uncharacterized protein cd34 isoform X2 [Cottoperca gobio]|uniref:Uncharacterized protein cd34 isoform X2 n=1 Tax=Cottoperca gobio TaxID=56716 RepID=A0A6J2P910_COTGO|nr:uncharacterized protein LOC115004492 isoform X2 [Cottoperca gobio]